jgi:hypothetical protein
MIRVELDTVPKWRNQNEWRPVNRARAEGYEETGDHSVIITLCKRLVADGYDPEETVEVWCGDCMAFCPGSLGTWASGGGWVGKQPEWLKKGQKAH